MINFFLALPLWLKILIPVFFAVVITLIVIAVVFKGFWKDKGFMKSKKSGKPLQWRNGDVIAVVVHTDVPLHWIATISAAVVRFNAAIGREMLISPIVAPSDYDWDRPPPKGTVAVKCDPMLEDKATTEHRYDLDSGEILSAVVTFPMEATFRMAIAVHEFGHVCGLDHDEHPESIMYPVLSVRREPGTLSDADTKRLRSVYGPS